MTHKGLRYFIALLLFVCCTSIHLKAQLPGSMDTSLYQAEGISANIGSTGTQVLSGVLLSDGSSIVVGNFTIFGNRNVGRIVKINADGSYNNTFNTGTGTGANGTINVIAKQPDGKLILGGDFTSFNGVTKNRLVRLNSDGSIDATFNVGTGCNNSVYSIFVQCDTVGCDSLIVVGGSFTNYNGTSLSRIVRLNYNGSRDATFSTTASGLGYVYDVVRQSTGKYVICGSQSNTVTGIKRLNADGTLDASFNSGGLGTRGPTSNNVVNKMLLLPDDRIYVVGRFTSYSDTTGVDSTANRIVLLNANGTRNSTFNGGSGFNGEVKYVSLTNDRKLVVTGAFTTYKGVTYNRVARIDTTGGVDSTFAIGTGISNTGMFIINAGSGKFLIGGTYLLYNNTARWGIARINSNGSLDNDFLKRSGLNNRVLDAAIQDDGKVILVGEFNKYNNDAVGNVVRINLDGSLDATFNSSGAGANNVVRAVAMLPNGKILIGGDFTTYNGTSRGRIALLNTDGTLDNSVFATGANATVTDIRIAPNGKIYISGAFGSVLGSTRSRLACLNPNLSLNSSGIGSKSTNGTVYHLGIQDNNRIIVSGYANVYDGVTKGKLFRIDTLGNIDSTFLITTGLTSSYSGAEINFQTDGKILIAAQSITYNGISKGPYARLNTDGSLDASFTVATTGNYWGGYDIVEYGNNIIVAGDHQTINSQPNISLGYVKQDGTASNEFYINGGMGGTYDRLLTTARLDNKYGRILVAGEFGSANGILAPQFAIFENYINELDINSTLCTGTSAKLLYNKGVSFNSGNIFTVQLSNASGSFASPVTIATDTTDGWGPDSIQVSIPAGTSSGTGYRVRIVSTSPAFTSLSTGPITINASPTQKTVLQTQAAVYPSLGTEVKVVASQTGVHYSLISDTTVVDTGNGSGDTLRLRTGSIYNAKNFVVKAQLGGCSLTLDTVIVDTLGLRHVSWQWEGFTKNPDNSITAEPEPGNDKMEGKSYNLIKRVKDGFVSFDLQSDNDYAGYLAFGDYNSSADVAMGFLLAQDTTSGPDTAGLYLMLEKDEFIPLRGFNGTALNIAVHKHGNIGDIYVNGLLQDTTITWPDTLDFDIELACFASGSNINWVKTSYIEYLRWNELQPTHANCGSTGSATASVFGGIPPYHFNWSNGDTTHTSDSLMVGMYHITVTDFAGDTLVDSVDIVYNAMIDSAHNVGPDSLGRMVSSGFTEFFSSYCWYVNTLPVGEDGWIRFDIPEGTNFQGYVGFSSNTLFDESHSGFGIMALGNSLYVTGDDIEGMTYLGSYEVGQKLSLKMRFEGDYLYCGKEEEWGIMEMSFYLPRATIFRPGIVQLAEGSIYPTPVTTFDCSQMFGNVSTIPATSISTQGSATIDVKGGTSPYTYVWSNAATTPMINVLPGSYTVTVTDQTSASITAKAFVGTYVDWLAFNNVEEDMQHQIVATANTPEGYSIQHNYAFGANALRPGQNGTFSFDFARAGDFSGSIGLATDYLMSYGSEGFGLVVVQDRMNMGIDPEIYYVDEEGDLQYFGSFTVQMPLNIKIKRTGNYIDIVKNDVGGISREYDDPLTFHPIVSPVFEGDKITRITADYGVPLQLFATTQNVSCEETSIGSIDLDVIGGEPPYHFNWSNGDTISNPDSLGIGLYTVAVWDAQLDTIVDSIYVGYGMAWDTTFNVGDTLGILVSQGNNSTGSFDSYAYGLNSLPASEDGWVEFVLPQNVAFNGALTMNANKYYDETTEGIGVNVVNGYMVITGSMLTSPVILANYKEAAGYRVRFSFTGDNIVITSKDLLGLALGRTVAVNHERQNTWSPSVIFGLNGAKVSSISSSFGCSEMHAEARIVPAAKTGNTGSIYIDVKGGTAPYTYIWSNSATTSSLTNVAIGDYSVTVQDQLGKTQTVNAFLGRYVDWEVLSGMVEVGNSVIYEGDTIDPDSTLTFFALGANSIKQGASGTVSFDIEYSKEFNGGLGFTQSGRVTDSEEGVLVAMTIILDIDDDKQLYVLDENGNPLFLGNLRDNLPINLKIDKTATDFTVTKNGISNITINQTFTSALSPVIIPLVPGDKVYQVTCDFGRRLGVNPIVTPITCGTTNTGSITAQAIGGIPPYTYHWNTGDTTDVNDSLIIGSYTVVVTDSIGDTAAAYITMGYGATWSSLVGVTVDGTNSLSPTLPFAGSAYAVGASTLYPIVGESGWMEFKVDAGVAFEGYFGLVNDMTFDENMVGLGILINDGHIYSSDTDPENENMYLGRYNQAVENKIRITKIADDEIEITVNGIVVLESEYEYPNTFKPVVYLNNDKSKVRSLVSSFCNTYADELLVNTSVLHVSPTHKGAIYIDVNGGVAPYKYVWSDIVALSDTVIDDISDSLLVQYDLLGINTEGLKVDISNSLKQMNANRVDLNPGNYSVNISDAASNVSIVNFKIGEISRFAYTDNLQNVGGTITKIGSNEWETNACISLSFSQAEDESYLNFEIVETGDFDFGYRSLTDTLSDDSTANFAQAEYKAEEYYFVKIRSGQLSYVSSEGGNVTNVATINEGDKVSMNLVGNIVYVKVNGVTTVTATHSTTSPYLLNSMARIYNTNSAFKILDNIIYRYE